MVFIFFHVLFLVYILIISGVLASVFLIKKKIGDFIIITMSYPILILQKLQSIVSRNYGDSK